MAVGLTTSRGTLSEPVTHLLVANAYALGFLYVGLLEYGHGIRGGEPPEEEAVAETVDEQSGDPAG